MNSETRFPCSFCDKHFKFRKFVYRHIRKVHNREPFDVKNTNIMCPEATCRASFFFRNQLRTHIMDVHKVALEVDKISFQTYEEFELWKQKVESEFKCSYLNRQSIKCLTTNHKRIYFLCNRSGKFTPSSTGKHKMKKIGSKKINGYCPSSIEVFMETEGVYVEFWKTHFGHSCDLEHLAIPKQEKMELANKIEEGIPFQQILDDVRNSVDPTEMKRINLLTRKDLHNIARQYNISNSEKLHKKDADSATLWLQRVESLCNELFDNADNTLDENWCIIKQIINKKLSQTDSIKMNEKDYLNETFGNFIDFFTESMQCNELFDNADNTLVEKWCIIKQIINKKLSQTDSIKMNEKDYLNKTFGSIINFFTESANDTNA